ncbi:MAG: endopeptidase La [Lentisphaeria bacterium]|nr:endopeptidase La [Lentisphaeria bacterium]
MNDDFKKKIAGEDRGSFTVNALGVTAETPLPIICLADTFIFPHSLASVCLTSEHDISSLDHSMQNERRLLTAYFLMPDGNEDVDERAGEYFYYDANRFAKIGVLVRVVKDIRLPDNTRQVVLRGLKRIVCQSFGRCKENKSVFVSRYQAHITSDGEDKLPSMLARQHAIRTMFSEYAGVHPMLPEDLRNTVMNAKAPSRMADHIADGVGFSDAEKFLLLTMPELKDRLDYLTILLNRECEVAKLGMKIHAEVQEAMSESQREFYLREQLKSIKAELGEMGGNSDVYALNQRIQASDIPKHVKECIFKELSRLDVLPQNAPEYHISYNYISWLLDIPWNVITEDDLNCARAEAILEADHFGLEDVKKRILEFLAVMQLKKDDDDLRAPILCLVGPPGVGKTSLGQSIARAMDRNFVRMSLGGMRDEAEIRGHRRTYVGAMPGRIVQNLKRAGSANPVFMLDEIDKLAHDFRGDPASALLEVLDPEQNNAFNDNFVELALDLSKVFFIATANVLEDIPSALRDRMEVIKLSGYTAPEKREIARRYLVKRQLQASGLTDKGVRFTQCAIDEIIDGYTREAGVRELDRVIARVCRRIAGKYLSGAYKGKKVISVTAKSVTELLGARRFIKDSVAETPVPGCAVGMAWTGVGGVVLPVETVMIPDGKGELKLTGSLGKVMQESANAALTFVRANAGELGVEQELFTRNDIHIHVPDGATPKDGPSAGITMTLALTSLFTGKPLIKQLAMTGEVTLSGKVTAIGGLREKLVGALGAGMKNILIPQENVKDLEEIPDYVKDKLSIVAVSTIKDALDYGFGRREFPPVKE